MTQELMHLQHFAGEIIMGKNSIPRIIWPSVSHLPACTDILNDFKSKTTVVLGQVIGVDTPRCLYIRPTFQLIRQIGNI
jgi:hypothetical protein